VEPTPDESANSSAPSRRGRPRSQKARDAVLRATRELLLEVGPQAMTTDQIAGRSGVSKATLYKWWPNKFAIAVEAFLREETVVSPVPDTGSAREDYRIWLRNTADLFAGPYGRVFAQLIGEGQANPKLRAELRERLLAPRRRMTRDIWDRAARRGELRADVDFETAMDLMIGAVTNRLLLGYAPLDEKAADAIVDTALYGFLAQS